MTREAAPGAGELKFRDPEHARELTARLKQLVGDIGRPKVSVMHVCGSHEQAIAKFGQRAVFPRALNVIMGPGCPVCITDKDSHEHFEIRTHNRLIDVLEPDSKTIDMLMRLNLPAGVDIEIKI